MENNVSDAQEGEIPVLGLGESLSQIPSARLAKSTRSQQPLSPSDLHQILVEWNQTRTDYPRNSCLHELFEMQVERSPDSTAVECGQEKLSYRELNERANRLARHLCDLRVGPEVLVGICLRRSLDMMVGLLGILKAGGAYVPLDPSYPEDMLNFMVRDAAMPVIVTRSDLTAILPRTEARIVCLDEAMFKQVSDETNPVSGAQPNNLAYVIYTSGSTGQPKGVMIPHRGLVNYLTWAIEAYGAANGSGSPLHSSISFDLTITSLFAPLLVGRRLQLLSEEQGPEALAEALREKDFSIVKITPAHLELLAIQMWEDDWSKRTETIVVGGEALFGRKLGFWREYAPKAVLVNEYGPTETAVGCCAYFVPEGPIPDGPVPIGRPIANTQLYVLDADLSPIPIGATGELYIGGDGLARGYLNQRELTENSFIANPFASLDSKASPKLYKTGDHVRYLPDGNLEFLGRIDHQVKIRGFRIELSGIEAVLCEHRSVEDAVVRIHERSDGEKLLVAYVVSKAQPVSIADLRQFVRARLPDYMTPTEFVILGSFPLTANGKVDRKALLFPKESKRVPAEYIAPRSEVERKLAQLWEEVLHLSEVDVNQNFFELGGQSILAMRLLLKINQAFQVELDALAFFEYATIESMARLIARGGEEANESKLVTLRKGGKGPPLFFVAAPFEFLRLADRTRGGPIIASHVPWSIEVLRAAVRLERSSLPAVEEMAAPHADLIRKSGLAESCIIGGYSYGGILAFEVARQLCRQGVVVEAVILFDSDSPMRDWERRRRKAYLHWTRVMRRGLSYLWERVVAHWRGERMHKDKKSLNYSDRELETPEGNWDAVDRIWKNALKSYHLRTLPSHGLLFRAQESSYMEYQDYDGYFGWQRWFRKGIDVLPVPGNHHTMWNDPNLHTLSEALNAWLEKLAALKSPKQT